jgi:hypothetical protein
MDDTVFECGLAGGPRVICPGGLEGCAHQHVSQTHLHEAVICSVWVDSHVYMLGLGLVYLFILRWSRCTPSLQAGNLLTLLSLLLLLLLL